MLGVVALIIAIAAAGWLLFHLGGNDSAPEAGEDGGSGSVKGKRAMPIFKIIVWLSLTAALLAAKLWPLAFMVLLAAGGVAAIEAWRGREIALDEANTARKAATPLAKTMSETEALSVLGLVQGANAEAVRNAHRKLIAQLHPDKGGTDYLASKINEARDCLLRQLGEE